jgi:MFS transporter, ACS family, tartrate transporter
MPGELNESALFKKLNAHLMPLLGTCFLAAFLDRVNVGFAALQMQTSLGLSEQVYSLGAGLFFLGYFLFEVPSNLILVRVGARFWIARIMVVWGALSAAMMLVTDEYSFYTLRFLLGAAEAGFFPGIILYLTQFYPVRFRTRAVALFMTAPALSGMIGAPLSGWLLEHHPDSLEGWQWLFLVEGLPSIGLGVLVWYRLPSRPIDCTWLDASEKQWLVQKLADEQVVDRTPDVNDHSVSRASKVSGVLTSLLQPRVLVLCFVYFLLVIGAYGFEFFMPKILKEAFPQVSTTELGLIAALPPLGSVFAMLLWGRRADRDGTSFQHVLWPALWAFSGLALASLGVRPSVALVAAIIAVAGRWSVVPPFWGIATRLLSATGAASAIALINSVGNLGGFAGPWLMGNLKTRTGSYSAGLQTLACAYIFGSVLIFALVKRVHRVPLHRTD